MSYSNVFKAFVALVVLVLSNVVSANEEYESQNDFQRMGFNISLGSVSFDSKVAETEGVEDSSTYLKFSWEGKKNHWVYGAGFSMYLYSDNKNFKQQVETGSGDRSTKDSDASAMSFFGESGYSHSFNDTFSVEMLGGYEHVFSSERAISYCSDCREEDIDISAGLYVKPQIRLSSENGLSFILSYQQYLSGDVDSGFTAGLSWWY